jgi:hypothetical protein
MKKTRSRKSRDTVPLKLAASAIVFHNSSKKKEMQADTNSGSCISGLRAKKFIILFQSSSSKTEIV